MSATTHDLTQRARQREIELRKQIGPDPYSADIIADLSAALVQAEQEKAELDRKATIILDVNEQHVARLATQAAAIRQVEQEMREMSQRSEEFWLAVGGESNLARWADTLRAILPAEQTTEQKNDARVDGHS